MYEEFIRGEELRKLYEEYEDSKEEYFRTLSYLEEEIELIYMRIEEGEPLRGSCKFCPKVIIGRD